MATRWAICGTGRIANDFCACLKALPTTEHQIVAVGAGSSKTKAEEFAKRFDVPNSYGSYEELLAFDGADVVYVSSIHPHHVELSLKAINAGKAVLCEKPMALSLEGCKKVLALAKEKGVLFVEAYWTRFFPAYAFIRDQIQTGNLGEIKMVTVTFGAPICDVPRIMDKSLGGGGLMDLGCYPVQVANFVYNEKPLSIWSEGTLCGKNGVDKAGVIVLSYSGGRYAVLNYTTETPFDNNSLNIRGTKGIITIPSEFWCPKKVVLNGDVKEFPLPVLKHEVKYPNSEGLTYEAQEVRRCLVNGLKESPYMSHADSEIVMGILQEVLNNFGIKFDAL